LAAEQGEAFAQLNLGWMYDKGDGVPQDYAEAVKWYRLAAEQGHAKAQYNLGVMYAKGRGVPKDYVQAYMWFNLSAAQGLDTAVKNRDSIGRKMTSVQLAEAQRLARNWRSNRAPSSTPSLPSVPTRLVRQIQTALAELGYDPGPADGIPGTKTIAAIRAFQRDYQIQPDGVLSSSLVALLNVAVASRSDPTPTTPEEKTPKLAGSGSGFTVAQDYLVTNHHVIDGCSAVVAVVESKSVVGTVIASSEADDVAIVKLDEPTANQARFRNPGRVRLGVSEHSIW